MKSVKPGRGPSAMGAVGSVTVVMFGIFWIAMAVSMRVPGFFLLFGVLFVLVGIIQAVYHFKNATGKNRYSSFDIVEDREEPDPLNQRFGTGMQDGSSQDDPGEAFRYCPYCGAKLGYEFEFCGKCGKKLPDSQ